MYLNESYLDVVTIKTHRYLETVEEKCNNVKKYLRNRNVTLDNQKSVSRSRTVAQQPPNSIESNTNSLCRIETVIRELSENLKQKHIADVMHVIVRKAQNLNYLLSYLVTKTEKLQYAINVKSQEIEKLIKDLQ